MMAAAPPTRTIEVIPALLVALLDGGGKLPPIPNEPQPGALGFHKPDLNDMQSAKWLALWEGPLVDEGGFRKVAGLATFRDLYEWHTASSVRELCAIRGSRRAVVELTRWLRDDAASQNRRLVGAIERFDCGLAKLVMKLGCRPVQRTMWEHAP
jgi:hypothetical protein